MTRQGYRPRRRGEERCGIRRREVVCERDGQFVIVELHSLAGDVLGEVGVPGGRLGREVLRSWMMSRDNCASGGSHKVYCTASATASG
jgi:hypothetical protein